MGNIFSTNNAKWSWSVLGVIFTIVPMNILESYGIFHFSSPVLTKTVNGIVNKVAVFIVITIVYGIYWKCRKSICIKGDNYSIVVKECDIFAMDDCKKVINFDECFTTRVGDKPEDMNPTSLCGQYLRRNPINDGQMKNLIKEVELQPEKQKSRYKNRDRYASGKLVPNGDYLLMAFARLNEKGRAELTPEEFHACLTLLWEEIDKYHGDKDICIPILGAGITGMKDSSLTAQKLLDIIIASYKLSPYKLNENRKLYIVFRKGDKISLNKVGSIF